MHLKIYLHLYSLIPLEIWGLWVIYAGMDKLQASFPNENVNEKRERK